MVADSESIPIYKLQKRVIIIFNVVYVQIVIIRKLQYGYTY